MSWHGVSILQTNVKLPMDFTFLPVSTLLRSPSVLDFLLSLSDPVFFLWRSLSLCFLSRLSLCPRRFALSLLLERDPDRERRLFEPDARVRDGDESLFEDDEEEEDLDRDRLRLYKRS